MRLFGASGTKTLPFASTARNSGSLNCPSPLPGLPNVVRNVPHATVSIVVVVVVGVATVVVLATGDVVLLDVLALEMVLDVLVLDVLLEVLVLEVLVGVAGSALATPSTK